MLERIESNINTTPAQTTRSQSVRYREAISSITSKGFQIDDSLEFLLRDFDRAMSYQFFAYRITLIIKILTFLKNQNLENENSLRAILFMNPNFFLFNFEDDENLTKNINLVIKAHSILKSYQVENNLNVIGKIFYDDCCFLDAKRTIEDAAYFSAAFCDLQKVNLGNHPLVARKFLQERCTYQYVKPFAQAVSYLCDEKIINRDTLDQDILLTLLNSCGSMETAKNIAESFMLLSVAKLTSNYTIRAVILQWCLLATKEKTIACTKGIIQGLEILSKHTLEKIPHIHHHVVHAGSNAPSIALSWVSDPKKETLVGYPRLFSKLEDLKKMPDLSKLIFSWKNYHVKGISVFYMPGNLYNADMIASLLYDKPTDELKLIASNLTIIDGKTEKPIDEITFQALTMHAHAINKPKLGVN